MKRFRSSFYFFLFCFLFIRTTESIGTQSEDDDDDSESILDEVVITSSSYDSHNYSPIHYCDNSAQSDDNSSTLPATSSSSSKPNYSPVNCISPSVTSYGQNFITTGSNNCNSNNQLSADVCNYKNSKSRRLEYSLRCLKFGRSNPSQDSAFGSLTDGEMSIASSSFRLSSFQSMTSPIDEGVEDIIVATTTELSGTETCLELTTSAAATAEVTVELCPSIPPPSPPPINFSTSMSIQIDSAVSSPCREVSPSSLSFSKAVDDEIRRSYFSLSLSPKKQLSESSTSPNYSFDPPTILVNDQNSTIYTTSPSRKSGLVEVFSQKYRVCSFEDMSPKRKNIRNVNKKSFRSLEEERRIDSAFTPIKDRTCSENRVYATRNSEDFKRSFHASFDQTRDSSNKDRLSMWKNSAFYRKNKIAKSNDSLLDSPLNSPKQFAHHNGKEYRKLSALNRGNSTNELASSRRNQDELLPMTSSRKSRSERYLFSLAKLKQTAINDYLSEDESEEPEMKAFQKETKIDDVQESSDELSPLHHQTFCKMIGGMDESSSNIEEKTPLLENMEMSPLTSPTETDVSPQM